MSEAGIWAVSLLAGAALGGVFFGGLWWTVQRGAESPSPARWFLGSFVLRTAVVLAGFYFIGGGQLERLGLCLIGFLLARALVLFATRQTPSDATPPCA
jgi:F1F0 ATPase subunit 2